MFFTVSLHIPGPILCVCLILHVFQFSRFNPCPTLYIAHFSHFSVFLAIFQWLWLIFNVFQFCCHIEGPTVCVSHILSFSLFLSIFHVVPCEFLIFLVCQVSRHKPGPITWFSFFLLLLVSFLNIFQVLQCAFFIFHVFQCLSYCTSYRVCVSFSTVVFLFITIQVLRLIFVIFQVFDCYLPYSRSYSVCFSFSRFFSVSRHIFCTTCENLIFLICQFSRHYPGTTVCVFLIFHGFHCFLPYSRSFSVCVSFSTFSVFPP